MESSLRLRRTNLKNEKMLVRVSMRVTRLRREKKAWRNSSEVVCWWMLLNLSDMI
jgi:hypothetical protein